MIKKTWQRKTKHSRIVQDLFQSTTFQDRGCFTTPFLKLFSLPDTVPLIGKNILAKFSQRDTTLKKFFQLVISRHITSIANSILSFLVFFRRKVNFFVHVFNLTRTYRKRQNLNLIHPKEKIDVQNLENKLSITTLAILVFLTRHNETFFENLLTEPKCPLLHFFDILQQNGF